MAEQGIIQNRMHDMRKKQRVVQDLLSITGTSRLFYEMSGVCNPWLKSSLLRTLLRVRGIYKKETSMSREIDHRGKKYLTAVIDKCIFRIIPRSQTYLIEGKILFAQKHKRR